MTSVIRKKKGINIVHQFALSWNLLNHELTGDKIF